MVFGWGKRKQETNDLPQETTVNLNQIDSLLLSKREEIRKKITVQSVPLFNQIQTELQAIYKIIEQLQKDDLKVEDIEKILRVIVTRAKTEVIEVISKESQNDIPKIHTFEDVMRTSESVSHTLKKIGDVLGKNSRVIHVFAKKYAQEIKDHLALVTKNHMIISKMIGDHNIHESLALDIKEKTLKIQSLSEKIIEHSNHIKKLQESQLSAQNIFKDTQQQIANTRQSPEFLHMLEIEKKLGDLKSQEESLDKEIDDEFSKVSRPLGKYIYVTSLDKPLKNTLERLVERASKVVGSESTDALKTILESCMKGIVSGTVSVKEADKSVEQINFLLSSLDVLASRKNKTLKQIQQLEMEIMELESVKLDSLEKKLAKSKSDQDDAQSKIGTLLKEIDSATFQKIELGQTIESSLTSILGIKYKISV